MSNYKVLFILKLLKSTIGIFVSSFFVMYFLNISNNNVPKLGLYYILVYTTVYLTAFLLKNLCKNKNRIHLLRIGIILNFIYFLMILFLKKDLVNYIYIMGIIYGLEEGFYYSVFNNFESNGVTNQERAKFSGFNTCIQSIISIVVPIVFGSIINEKGFQNCTFIILILVVLQIIFSFAFKDNNLELGKKVNLKKYRKVVKKYDITKNVYRNGIVYGLTYSGAFKSVIVIYIIKVLNTNLDLGIFSAVFAMITSIMGLLFAKAIKKEHYNIIYKISTVLTIIGLILLMVKVNFVTVIIFNLFVSFSSSLCNLIVGKALMDVANLPIIKQTYKVEYFVLNEEKLFIGRFFGYLLYIVLGLSSIKIITDSVLIIFAISLIFLSYYTTKLQTSILNNRQI